MDDKNPNLLPQTRWAPEEGNRVTAPRVVWWFRVYCVLATIFWVGTALNGLVAFRADPIEGAAFVLGGLLFGLLFAAPLILPQRGWAWGYGLMLVVVSLFSCCLPFAIPLLIFWVQSPTREFFEALESDDTEEDYP